MITIFFRTIIVYFFLVIAMKMGGKRQVGELQISELVTTLLLSEIASLPIGHDDIPLAFAIIPVMTVISLEVISAFIVTKNQNLKRFFGGTPTVIIRKGKLDINALSKLPMGLEEFISEARLKGIPDISDLEYAILESNGKLAVFEKAKKNEKETGIAHTVIVDGNVSDYGLKCTGMDKNTLHQRLKSKGTDVEQVFLYTVNDAGEESWVFRNDKKNRKERRANK